jgi:hypothetical protein
MSYTNGQKSSAELEREVSEQRSRVEARIGEIRERLSPGQLVDEVLSYTKDSGGKFAANLGQQITANPLPAALVGVGLAWLIASNANPGAQNRPAMSSWTEREGDDEYPYAKVSGSVRRISHAADESGQWWSEFDTDTGQRYKAAADSMGRRAGHFTDQAGKKFTGFIDDAGNRVRQFQDESGNALDETLGWASHSWRQAQGAVSRQFQGAAGSASRLAGNVASQAQNLSGNVGNTVQTQADQLSRQVMSLFEQQPLVAGALAFAVGAALGAGLPHTAQEDSLLGEQADKVRGKATAAAGDIYQRGKDKASEVYSELTDKAGQAYSETKEKVAELGSRENGTANLH